MTAERDDRARAEDGSAERTPLVLIAEDERAIAAFVSEVVALAGYMPRVVTHGQQGRELLREVWPDLLLTDLMMPHLDGAGLIGALRAEAAARGLPVPPVILMTASGLAVAAVAGADAILRKPFTMDELGALLRRFLAPPLRLRGGGAGGHNAPPTDHPAGGR